MRFHAAALLTGATAVAANTATLLLPGFQGHDLQAGVLNTVRAQSRRAIDFAEVCGWKRMSRLTMISERRDHHLPGDLPHDRGCL